MTLKKKGERFPVGEGLTHRAGFEVRMSALSQGRQVTPVDGRSSFVSQQENGALVL